jgi:hypothetical protein
MEKPEITKEQMEHLMKHFGSTPRVRVLEEGTLETRALYSAEELAERRGKGGTVVRGWWTR